MLGFLSFCDTIITMKELLDILLDAGKDSLIVFPFIFIIYIVMELIENARKKEKIEGVLRSKYAPVFATLSGIVPECGFSVMCSKLYSNGLIKTGTLIAGFIATSDEGLIVMISSGASVVDILKLVGVKIVYAIILGLIFNVIFNKIDNEHVCTEKDSCTECGEEHKKPIDKYFLHPLTHALKTFAFIFLLNVVFGGLLYLIGEERLQRFIASSKTFEPIFCSLIGLIPNCASSIVIASGYINGLIGFSGLIAGLCTNAGMGLLILIKEKKTRKKALLILPIMFLTGVIIGYIFMI